MTIKEVYTVLIREIKEIKQAFSDFKANDFLHLEKKVDNVAKAVYIGIGIVLTIQFLILAKIIF